MTHDSNNLTKNDVKILKEEILYKGFYQVRKYRLKHKRFAGGESDPFDRELIIRYRVAASLPYDPILNKVVLIKQFRIGALDNEASPWLWEVVAGIRTTEETLEDLAKRETFEETGLTAQDILPICDYWVSPGGSQERVALFLTRVDASKAGGIFGLPEEHEDILVKALPVQDAFELVHKGLVNNALSIIALQWLELNLEKVQKKWLK